MSQAGVTLPVPFCPHVPPPRSRQRPSRPGGTSRAFTLIELLVVVTIVAVLAGILFPVFASARAKVRQATCQSNLRQIGVALLAYSFDYDETLPVSNYSKAGQASAVPSTVPWMHLVDPYVRSGYPDEGVPDREFGIFTCPDFVQVARTNFPASSYIVNRYLMPAHLPEAAQVWGLPAPAALSFIGGPSRVVLAMDGAGHRIFTDGNDHTSSAGLPAIVGQTQAVYLIGRARHKGAGNYLFADGHVRAFRAPAGGRSCTYRGPNWWDLNPVPSSRGVVWHEPAGDDSGAASGWFLERQPFTQ